MAYDLAKGQGYKPLNSDSIALEEVSINRKKILKQYILDEEAIMRYGHVVIASAYFDTVF